MTDPLYTCAAGLAHRLSKAPLSTTHNLEVVDRVAHEAADKLGKPFTIYRYSLGQWHCYRAVNPRPSTLVHGAKPKSKPAVKVVKAKSAVRANGLGNPFQDLPVAKRCDVVRYLLAHLVPESQKLKDTPVNTWLMQRIPALVQQTQAE